MLPYKQIEIRLKKAVATVLPDVDISSVLVRPCPDPNFGDYQSNSLISLAKQRKLNPRQLASDVLSQVDLSDCCASVEVAGAGFLNFRLNTEILNLTLASAARGEHLFFTPVATPKTFVVDFSSPNVAKPMHVGHIRSTVLGDCLARILRLLNHHVITDNHLGDWGTQFGMLIVGWKTLLDRTNLEQDALGEMERIYKAISARCDQDRPEFEPLILERARSELVKLQSADSENLVIWQEMIRLSQRQFDSIYSRLGVSFDHTLGESFYNPFLQETVDHLVSRGIASESRGAKVVFSDGTLPPKEDPFLINKDGKWVPNPFIVQKQDGAFNYATTDLATLSYRKEHFKADVVLYVTDGRQQLHFRQLFATYRRWQPEIPIRLEHVWFGSILGEDGKPFKTRSGETVRLADLLDEAEERALKVVEQKNPEKTTTEKKEIARVVGLGAIKYADLLPNRQTDYVFSWDKMLALNGNTAPYLQYAYARICSIFRKGGIQMEDSANKAIQVSLQSPEEISLSKHLLNFHLVLTAVASEYRPNFLCNYLYGLAGLFTAFYEKCPVLKAEPEQRLTRLVLCDLTAKVLHQGLELLGIETLEQM